VVWGCPQRKVLLESAAGLYPLHPTVLPVLIRTFRRFGQNERSLFSFLLSHEPCGLQAFSERYVGTGDLYRLYDFYDYVRVNFGHRLAAQSYRNHWNVIDAAVETFATEDELELNILKIVGILNLLNDGDLLPTEDSLVCAIVGVDQAKQKRAREAVEKLRQGKRILYDRGRARGLCVWPHSSVDLEKVYEEACRATDTPQRIATFMMDFLETRSVVARRHYVVHFTADEKHQLCEELGRITYGTTKNTAKKRKRLEDACRYNVRCEAHEVGKSLCVVGARWIRCRNRTVLRLHHATPAFDRDGKKRASRQELGMLVSAE